MTDKSMFKSMGYDSLDKQVDGNHYKGMKIQPAEFINENNLLFAEGNAIKYICRHSKKGKTVLEDPGQPNYLAGRRNKWARISGGRKPPP